MQIITVCSLGLFTRDVPIYVVNAETQETVCPTQYCTMGPELANNLLLVAQSHNSDLIVLTGSHDYALGLKEEIDTQAKIEYSNKEITVIIQ